MIGEGLESIDDLRLELRGLPVLEGQVAPRETEDTSGNRSARDLTLLPHLPCG
jgi:hypothetical protein